MREAEEDDSNREERICQPNELYEWIAVRANDVVNLGVCDSNQVCVVEKEEKKKNIEKVATR